MSLIHFLYVGIFQYKIMNVTSQNSYFTEVISVSPTDSATISDCQANRIQLVSALQIGGVTPAYGLIRRSLQVANVPTNIIIRHQNNGFQYTEQEKNLMLDQIIACKQMFKPAGVVVGSIEKNGNQCYPDMQFVSKVIEQVGGKMSVTFHKASDHMNPYSQGIMQLLDGKVNQILTQGGLLKANEAENIQNICSLTEQIRRNNILCGGGITKENKLQVLNAWGSKRVHIGTCVRNNRYGPVNKDKLLEFLSI